MRFGRAATIEDVDAESFERFAADAGLGLPFLRRRAAALAVRVQKVIAEGVTVPGLKDGDCLASFPRSSSTAPLGS